MGMIGNLLRVSQEELNSYIANSALLENRVYSPEIDEKLTDIDKSWNIIAFLLGGADEEYEDHPMARIIFGSGIIDPNQNMGIGPASYLQADEVKELYTALTSITDDDLKSKLDFDLLLDNDIYPVDWFEEADKSDEVWNYVLQNIHLVRDTFQKASENNEAIITYII